MSDNFSVDGMRFVHIPRRPSGQGTRRVDLGVRARDHVEAAARSCGGALGEEVLALGIPVERVWTYLGPSEEPPPFDEHLGDSLMDQSLLIEEIEAHLASSDSSAIVFRDSSAEPDDEFLGRLRTAWFTLGNEVYHHLRGPQARAEVEAFLSATDDFERFGVLTNMSQPLSGEVGRSAVAELARAARYALVSAWIGDGDLVWALA